MQEPRSKGTLELIVSEQHSSSNSNMSQIDLGNGITTEPSAAPSQQQAHQQQQQPTGKGPLFDLEDLKRWPGQFRASFTAKLDEAKAKSDSQTEYVLKVIQAFSGIVIWILCFLSTIIVPIVLFFLGLTNLDNCADRPSLPYLVFAIGFVMSCSNLFNLAMALDLPVLSNHKLLSDDVKNTIASILNIIFNCLVVFLYILSAYMVFNMGAAKQVPPELVAVAGEGETSPQVDCSDSLYLFTFWFVALTLGLFVVLALLTTILFAYNQYRLAIIRGSTPRSQQATGTATTNLSGQTNPAFVT